MLSCTCSSAQTAHIMAGKYLKRFKSIKIRRRRTPPTATQKTPKIIKHAKRGQFRKLVQALDRGEHVNSVDRQRRSALFHAALGGHKKCLKELLRRGANPNL